MGENKKLMLAGEWYIADDEELGADTRRREEWCREFNTATDPERRQEALRELLGSVGEGVGVRPPFQCDYGSYISIGARTFVNFNAVFLDAAPITVGADVQIGPNVQLLTPTHELDTERRRAGWEKALPITIGDIWPSAKIISPWPMIWLDSAIRISGVQLCGITFSPSRLATISSGNMLATVDSASAGIPVANI